MKTLHLIMKSDVWHTPLLFCFLVVLSACKTKTILHQTLEPLVVKANSEQGPAEHFGYRKSKTRETDILHTTLHLECDWKKKEISGKAILFIKPYFYPTNSITLDAKAFTIHSVNLYHRNAQVTSNHTYNNYQLNISTDQTFTRTDTLRIEIDYTAHPYDIASFCPDLDPHAHGFYFITPDETTPTKPYQIWTQNEPEDASLWFPTNDNTAERMTQELHITIGDSMQTLSNGVLIKSLKHNNGTRTDVWRQDKPHAPYLTALIAGKYSVIKTQYNNIPVWYYLEPYYETYAQSLLGNTVEMIDFYSSKLGVPFPWDKYHQVYVRDYVSGAMENTSCVVLGEYMQLTDREQLGNNHEQTIAHELFHQWFGNLVTCESWANLPLNESFANYGEYLWIEYKYGKEAADIHHMEEMQGYKNEALYKNENLIRYYHHDAEDMFDAHSYNKGGRVLHMLRHIVGDDAFFDALKLYLTRYAFQAAEIHHLRLVFEEITGEDLNWFFSQWFLNKGFPTLEIGYSFNKEKKKQFVTIEQTQNATFAPLFRLPIDITLYFDGKPKNHRVWLDSAIQTFVFDVQNEPDFINVDEDGVLLANINDNKPSSKFALQFKYGGNILDKTRALTHFEELHAKLWSSDITSAIWDALHHPFAAVRIQAIPLATRLPESDKQKLVAYLKNAIINDPDADVRITAIQKSISILNESERKILLQNACNDKAWKVVNVAINELVETDPNFVISFIYQTLNDNPKSSSFVSNVAYLLSGLGEDTTLANLYFNSYTLLSDPGEEMEYLYAMGNFMSKAPGNIKEKAIEFFSIIIKNDPMWYPRVAAFEAIGTIIESDLQISVKDKNLSVRKEAKNRADFAKALYNRLLASERHPELIKYVAPY